MPSGFFMGGLAEGMAASDDRALKERTLAADTGLRSRGLDIQEAQLKRAEQQDVLTRVDKQIADTMATVAETVKQSTAVGRDPLTIQKAVMPLVASAKALAAKAGRDPAALDAAVSAMITNPGMIETAKAAGTAKGTEQVAMIETITGSKGGAESFILDPSKRAEAENKLRDDYQKLSKDFITVRDFHDRIQNAGVSGAGDLTLVFSFMKSLDPGSTVREGEYANAQNAAGVPEAIRGMWNNLVGGGKLGQGARDQIKSEAEVVFRKAAERHNFMTTQFANIAKRQGLNTKNVIVDVLTDKDKETFEDKWLSTVGGIKFKLPR